MKRLFLVFLFVSTTLYSQAQLVATEKVKATFSSAILKSFTEDQIAELNFRANHLVTVESTKLITSNNFALKLLENGGQVVLTDSELMNFNPLRYAIPQDEVVCNNLQVQSVEGNSYLLVVLSQQQYNQQLNQYLRNIKKQK
jgi:hypothetical protein